MSSTKRPRYDNSVAVTIPEGSEYATRDANPPIMPVPRHVANQLNDYATYTLKYSQAYNELYIDAGAKLSKQFRPNSLYDFDYTGVGHQPLGRDLLAAMYNYYRVLKCVITCSVAPYAKIENVDGTTTTAYASPLIIGDLVGTGQATTPTVVYTLGEMKRGRVWMSESNGGVSTWTRVIYPGMLDETIDTNGITDQAQQSIWTPMGANPAEEQYYTIMINSFDAKKYYLALLVQATFTVQFRSPNVDAVED